MPKIPQQPETPEPGALDSAAELLVRLAAAAMMPVEHPQGGELVTLPEGFRVVRMEPLEPELTHVKQVVDLEDLPSFIAYVNDYRMEATRIFVDAAAPALLAVLDYHAGESPARCAHRVAFAPPMAEEWRRWTAIDGKPMAQAAFAEFLEENLRDVREPPGADVLETVASLKAVKSVSFESGLELQSGAVQLTYHEKVEGAGKNTLEIPSQLTLGLPVFFNGEGYEVTAFLRYRIGEGQLAFVVKLHQRQYIERDAVLAMTKAVEEAVKAPLVFGKPR